MIEDRKLDHINICLKENVESSIGPGFSDIAFVHRAAPDLDMAKIDLATTILGK